MENKREREREREKSENVMYVDLGSCVDPTEDFPSLVLCCALCLRGRVYEAVRR